MTFNLREDFMKRFNIKSVHEPKPTPSVNSEPVKEFKEKESKPDLVVKQVVSEPINVPTPNDWIANTDTSTDHTSLRAPNRRRVLTEPVILNNKAYRSNGTANWGSIRKAVYPLYRQFCVEEGCVPNITEFTKLIGPRWKELSPEDKAKAVVNPAEYFSF